jgi:hypothetical protein
VNFSQNSTCGEFGIHNQSPQKDCLRTPTTRGCRPLNVFGSTSTLATCNDGSAVPVVPDVASRTWEMLAGPVATPGTEQQRIERLMNNAAAALGCATSFEAVANTFRGEGYMKWYGTSQAPRSCGVAYFSRSTNCAVAMVGTGKPTPSGVTVPALILSRFQSLGLDRGSLGIPTSFPVVEPDATGVTWQRFSRGYVTHRAPDTYAFYVGGDQYPEDVAIAARYGSTFDYGNGKNLWPLAQDLACSNPINGSCDANKTGRYTRTLGAVNAGPETGYPMTVIGRNGCTQAFAVRGTIASAWSGRSAPPVGANGVGYPTGDATWSASLSRSVQPFERALYMQLSEDPKKTFVIEGAMMSYYTSRNASALLNVPTANAVAIAGGGFVQTFANGNVYRAPDGSVYGVRGGQNSILQAYLASGGPSGAYGFPIEDAPGNDTGMPLQLVQHFQHGTFSIQTGGTATGEIWAPVVTPPGHVVINGRTSSSVGLGWYEVAQNDFTLIYRQPYNNDGYPVGAFTLIKTLSNLTPGPHSFIDSADTTDDQSSPNADQLYCYFIKERHGPSCSHTVGGYSCASSPTVCAYTQAATPKSVGRAQLRIKASTASTADAQNNRIQVRLQSPYVPFGDTPYPRQNSSWIDSTNVDFTAGSNYTYDLLLGGISDKSDITQIAIASPDSDGFCVNEVELLVDNTRAFFKSFGANGVDCQWIYRSGSFDGKQLSIRFGELRQSSDWINFNPPNLGQSFGTVASFVGYRPPEFIAMLDSVLANRLKDPANNHGEGTGFRDSNSTVTTRTNRRTMHVVQHITAKDFGWIGDVAANPAYDLVIHNGATCAPKNWCVTVENLEPGASSLGWWNLFPVVGIAISAAINSSANGQMKKAMSSMGGNSLDDPPAGTEYCFPNATNERSLFYSQGFDDGSFTLCFAFVE